MSIREREERVRQLRNEVDERKKEEELCDRTLAEKWKVEDEERALRHELLVQARERERLLQIEGHDRQAIEMKHRVHELEKELQVMQVEKERSLRKIEEDNLLANQ